MRRIVLQRTNYLTTCTLGKLAVLGDDDQPIAEVCTLELPWLNNARGASCIPPGKYPIILQYSPAFKRKLWELHNVPNRSEVKIHAANFVRQLKGCIAPCLSFADIDGDRITDGLNSAKALQMIHDALSGMTETTIEVI